LTETLKALAGVRRRKPLATAAVKAPLRRSTCPRGTDADAVEKMSTPLDAVVHAGPTSCPLWTCPERGRSIEVGAPGALRWQLAMAATLAVRCKEGRYGPA
jgi:hypothetical protein